MTKKIFSYLFFITNLRIAIYKSSSNFTETYKDSFKRFSHKIRRVGKNNYKNRILNGEIRVFFQFYLFFAIKVFFP